MAQDSPRTYRPIRIRHPTITVKPSALQTTFFPDGPRAYARPLRNCDKGQLRNRPAGE